MASLALIVGCSGLALTAEEEVFLKASDPWGFILFKRNIDTPDQVRSLTSALRETVGRDAPIFIDQEGGRVQRMGPPHWPLYPSGRTYGRLYRQDPIKAAEAAWLGARLIAHDLRAVGIDGDCLPVLDVPVAGAHDVIGDRAYDENPETVSILARAAAEGLLAGGVLPVIKHIPGHGRASADSHLSLPVVDASLDELSASDFVPFQALADMPVAMTAHVVYSAIDPKRPATASGEIIEMIIRDQIGFHGLLMTDDLSMQALSGTLAERAVAAIKASCDILLHCNGRLDEMREIASVAPRLSGVSLEWAEEALSLRQKAQPLDVETARRQFEDALATVTQA